MAIETRISPDDKKPRYLVRIEVRSPDGRRKQQRIGTFTSKKKAELAEAEAITKRESGTLLVPDQTTVAELMSEWLKVKAGEVTANSLHDYRVTVDRHIGPALGTKKIQQLNAPILQAQYSAWSDQGLSNRVIRGCHMRLSQAFDFAIRMKLLLHNPVRDARPPKLGKAKFDHWNPAEAATFLSFANRDYLAPLWDLLLREGVRRGEGLGLRWQDVNWERGTAHISQSVIPDKSNRGSALIQRRTKTASGSRTIHLSLETLNAFREHRRIQVERQFSATEWEPNDLIICTSSGRPINPTNVTRSFNALVKAAGVRRIKVHELRHTSATLLLLGGIPAKVVSEKLGHASIAITLDTYSHVLPSMQEDAANRMSEILGSALPNSDRPELH